MVSMCSEKPICAPPHHSEVSPTLPLKWFQCSSDLRWLSLVLPRKIVLRFLFQRLSPPRDRWCDVLGSVPTGSVSSSWTLQISQEASHLWELLCPPVYLLSHFPSLRHVRAGHPQEFSKVAVDHRHILDRISHSTFCSKLIKSVRMMATGMRGLTVTSWGNPAWVTASTSIVKLEVETIIQAVLVVAPCFDSEAPPCLCVSVTGCVSSLSPQTCLDP